MDIFHIVLEGVNGYSVAKFWEDKTSEMYASSGGDVCVLSWKPNGIYIVGGPEFKEKVKACISSIYVNNVDAMKNLCWNIVFGNMTTELLQKALDRKFDEGVVFGDNSRLDKIRKALGVA